MAKGDENATTPQVSKPCRSTNSDKKSPILSNSRNSGEPRSGCSGGSNISPASRNVKSEEEFISSVAAKIAAQPLQYSDPDVWGVLTAISEKARKRNQWNDEVSEVCSVVILDPEDEQAPVDPEDEQAPVDPEDEQAPVDPENEPVLVGLEKEPAPVGLEKEPAPVGLEKEPAPVGLEKEPAPVGLENEPAPVDIEKGQAPIDRENGQAPFDRENGQASVDLENGPAHVHPENEQGPVHPENEQAHVDPEIQESDNISSLPQILTNGPLHEFRLLYPIDKPSNAEPSNDRVHLYRALSYEAFKINDVAVKFVDIVERPQGYDNLQNQVDRSNSVADHDNILKIKPPFISDEGYYCIVFPYMDMGSVRTVMTAQFPNGIREKNIAFVLRDTVQGLAAIHAANQHHKEISTAHVFFKVKSATELEFKLGFGASVHDFYIGDTTLFLPPDAVSAPEVVHSDYQDYSAKADIWLVGIMALEMAYGGGYVSSRDELLAMVEEINRKKKLPKKLNKQGTTDLKQKQKIVDFVDFVRIENPFSEKFQNFVVKCLDLDPAIRPTAESLLNHEFMMIM